LIKQGEFSQILKYKEIHKPDMDKAIYRTIPWKGKQAIFDEIIKEGELTQVA
jgi:hypothetical protein